MRCCPQCGRELADGVRFCQGCGASFPAAPARPDPVRKSGGHKALTIALWTSLVVDILLCVLLVSITLGAMGASSQMKALEEQVEQWDP